MRKGALSYKLLLLAAVSAACGGTLALRGNAGPTIEEIWQGGVTATSTAGGGGESARAGGMGMGQGGSSAMSQFREAQKYTFQLMRLARGLRTLTEGGQDALTAVQAKAILAVLQPLRDQPKLTQDQAKEAIRAIQATLTEAQRTVLAQQRNQRSGAGGSGMGGGMGGGMMGGGMGGPGGAPGGGRPRFDPAAMKDFNPFARQAGANAPGPGGRGRSMDSLFTALEKLSAGAK